MVCREWVLNCIRWGNVNTAGKLNKFNKDLVKNVSLLALLLMETA